MEQKAERKWFYYALVGMFIGVIIAFPIRFIKGESAFGMRVLGPIAVGDLILIGGFILGALYGLMIKGKQN